MSGGAVLALLAVYMLAVALFTCLAFVLIVVVPTSLGRPRETSWRASKVMFLVLCLVMLSVASGNATADQRTHAQDNVYTPFGAAWR